MKQLLTLTLLFTITNGYSQDWTFMPKGIPTSRVKVSNDTLEILGNAIKFIKIEGKTYEIKRNTELKEVKPNWTTVLQEFAIKTDSSLGIRYYNKPTKQ